MSPRRGLDGSPQPDTHKHLSPDQAPAGETPQQKSERRLEHLRRLGKIYDDLENIEAFRVSPFMEHLSEEERKTQTREMYARVLGKYRPFLERVNMEDGQREKALAALQLEGTEAMGPKALQDHVLRVARKVERTVARAIHATQAERTVLRKEAAKHRVTEFTFAKERSSGAKGKRPRREAKDAPDWPVPLGEKTAYEYQGGAISGGDVWEKKARKVYEGAIASSDLPVRQPEEEPEDPIRVAEMDEERFAKRIRRRPSGSADTSHATDTTHDAEFEVVEEEPVTVEEEEPAVDLGEPTETIEVLQGRVRKAIETKYRRHFGRPQEEVRSWGAIVEGKASALKNVPGAEVYGIVNEKPFGNEDRVTISKDGLRFAAIDGMGGHGDGDKAAEVLARHMLAESEDSLPLRAEQAYMELKEMSEQHRINEIAGACFAAVELGVDGEKVVATIAHAGDVKAIVVGKDGTVRFATHDFSLVQSMVDEKTITEDQALYHPDRNIVTSALAANAFPLPLGDRTEQFKALVWDKRRALDVRDAIDRLQTKGLSKEDHQRLYDEVRGFYEEGKYQTSGMGLSTVELQEGDTLYAYTDGISDNLTVEELQEALKRNGGQIANVLEGIQERIRAYDMGELGLEDEREQNGAYKDGLKCKPKEDDKGFVQFEVKDLAALRDHVRKVRGKGASVEETTEEATEETPMDVAARKEPPTIDAEFEVVEPEDNGERGVVLANPDVVDAEFDDRAQLVQEAIELAGGGGQEPPRDADSGFDVDEEEMKPANDPRYGRGSGGAGVAAGVVGVGVAAAAAGGGGGGRRGVWVSAKAAASAVGRFMKGGVQGGSGDLWRGIMSYELARTVKRWTHAVGTVTFDWTDSILKRLQDIAHSASFSWLPFSSKWSKEDRDSITDLKPEDKKKAA